MPDTLLSSASDPGSSTQAFSLPFRGRTIQPSAGEVDLSRGDRSSANLNVNHTRPTYVHTKRFDQDILTIGETWGKIEFQFQ